MKTPIVALSVFLALVTAREAHASGLVLAPEGAHPEVLHEEVATTFGASRVTHWTRLSLSGDVARFVWLTPLTVPSRVDFASDAWLTSLEAASAPRVVPPEGQAPCASPTAPELDAYSLGGELQEVTDSQLITSDEALNAYARTVGVIVTDEAEAAALGTFEEGGALLALTFAGGSGVVRTPTVRVTGPGAPSTGANAGAGFSTLYTIGPAPAALGGAPVPIDLSKVTWGERGSNFGSLRFSALVAAGPGDFLVESASQRALFVPRLEDVVAFPSVAEGYFGSAQCEVAAESFATSSDIVSTTCGAGTLTMLGADACDETAINGMLDAHTVRCGGDDFALALSGATPRTTVLTRALTFGESAVAIAAANQEKTAVVHAVSYDAICLAAETTSTNNAGNGASGSGNGSDNGSGGDIIISAPDNADPTIDTGDDSSDDGCDGSSSDSSDSSGGDDCGSDSGGGGDGCSGDTGGGGGGCSGGGGGGDDCSVTPHHHGRARHKSSPMSRLALGAAVILFYARRRGSQRQPNASTNQ